MISLSLAITHTPWVPERVASFGRLCLQLSREADVMPPPDVAAFKLFNEKAPNWQWSREMWDWALSTGTQYHLFLQDDIQVAPNFFPALRAMIEAHPDQVIGLHSNYPFAQKLYDEGAHGYTSRDAVVGPGYVFPHDLLREFLAWRESVTDVEKITEDMLINVFLLTTKREAWHPLPTIIDHDVESLASTYGNDKHQCRTAPVTWRNAGILSEMNCCDWWELEAPSIGRFFDATHHLARKHVLAFTDADFFEEARLLRKQRRGDAPCLVIATPTQDGLVSEHYAQSIWSLARMSDVELLRTMTHDSDVVKARSRIVRLFLEGDEGTILFFLDGDVKVDPLCVAGMMRAIVRGGKDFVAAPYPKKKVRWEQVTPEALSKTKKKAEALAYHYPVRAKQGAIKDIDADQCIAIEGIGLGCAMVSKRMLLAMIEEYGKALVFNDLIDGVAYPTIALFALMQIGQDLLSEDYSFAKRWTQMGGKIHMYLGPGSPVSHVGYHVYEGQLEALGATREAKK